ncbi:DUF4421 domain-containing protein [Chitinophaga rupis]|nr:DUF4421 domain-containing protein [Chitinophaga rupis]
MLQHMRLQLVLLLAGLGSTMVAQGQKNTFGEKVFGWLRTQNDSAYITDHTRDLNLRLYGGRKYTYYDVVDRKLNKEVLYRPNNNFIVGVGANYKFLDINLGFSLPDVEHNKDRYGTTKYLDLQTHIYLRKLVIDLYWQRYKGYFLADQGGPLGNVLEDRPRLLRPDLRTRNYGASVMYIFNDRRFSYRGAYLQNEHQKKSAGSLIIGAEIFSIRIHADSSIIPSNLQSPDFFEGQRFYGSGIVSVAGNAGYAYTLVYKKHLFMTLSLSGALGVNVTRLYMNDSIPKKAGWQLNNTIRASIGYNSNLYFAGFQYMNVLTRSETPVKETYQTFGTGNFRISLVRRFKLRKKLF